VFLIPYRDLFQYQVAYAAEAARLFKEVVGQGRVSDEMLGKMVEIEHQGDNAAHMIIEQLDKVFITPFDREDIHALAMQVDDITDRDFEGLASPRTSRNPCRQNVTTHLHFRRIRPPETPVKRKKVTFLSGNSTTSMLTLSGSPCGKMVNEGRIRSYEIRRRSAEDQP
jgi:hypothetical protein